MAEVARDREVFHGSETLTPGLGTLGWSAHRSASRQRLHRHRHRGLVELCYLVSGEVEWWAGQETFRVGPRMLYVTQPGEAHGGINNVLHPCELYWWHVRPPRRQGYAGLSRQDSAWVHQRLRGVRDRVFFGDEAVRRALEEMRLGMRSARAGQAGAETRKHGPLHRATVRGAFLELLASVLRCHEAHAFERTGLQPSISTPVRRAVMWMREHVHEDYGLDRAAAAAGLSVTRLHERFRAETGFSPGEWRTRCRVAEAKRLLDASELSMASVAMRCGFSSSQYFATVFRKLEGISPTEYRARYAANGHGGQPETPAEAR